MLRILLIDDNPHNRLLVIHALEKEFAELQVQQIIHLEEFEQALSKGEFDLAITDYQLRWNDGLAVLRLIKSRYPDCPVIMFTNSGTQEVAVEAMKSGLDDYVIKSPSHYVRLPAAVRLALERIETRRKVAGLEVRFQTLLNQLDVGVYRLTADGALLEGNSAFLHLLGLNSLTEIPENQTLEYYFQPEDYAELLHQLKQGGNVRDREIQLRRTDGSVIWVRISKTFTTVDGTVVIDGLMENITKRKVAEKALRESEARFRWLFESNAIAIAFWDINGNITEANDAYLQLIGYTRQEMFLGKLRWTDITSSESQDVQQQIMAELNQYGVSAPKEKYYIHKAGHHIPVLMGSAFRVGSQSDGITFVIDLTERKRSEQERENLLQRERRARSEAEAANRIKDEFLAILSHELRSPLNPILGWTKLLSTRKLDAAKTAEALAIIERNAKLQAQLIEDLLDVSQILRGKLSLNISSVDLVEVISAALDTVRLAAQAKAIEIHTVFEPNIGLVLGDETRLQQVVWNLLSNAIKFTPQGGRVEVRLSKGLGTRDKQEDKEHLVQGDKGKDSDSHLLPLSTDTFPNGGNPRTEVSSPTHLVHARCYNALNPRNALAPPSSSPNPQSPIAHYAQITVTDTGQGINSDFLPYVFDCFRQADSKTTRQFGGLGLGLAIVKHLVEMHGGTVRAESQGQGQGATFTVMLPLMTVQPQTPEDSEQSQKSLDLSGVRVLVVDDDVDSRELVTFVLEEYGAQVTAVTSALEALQAVVKSKPNVLVFDIGMPEVDGYMLLRQIRSLPPQQGGEIPAIALTAYAGEVDKRQALAAGFQMHLPKPVDPAELVGVIASLVL
ncbi:response regulator [Chlorogloeopsis fritschii PCC 9212]|uniref:hybrid sensor histidine kinase/response regulator n=1 Tax=Chlorogloeopsis fritschii TaxID=1124 RepID=UPI00370D33A1